MTTRSAIGASQRRCALLACLASAWFLGFAVLGMVHALGFLAPTLALLALLILDRYPGAAAIERRVLRRRPTVARRRPGLARVGHRTMWPRRRSLARATAVRGPPLATSST